MDVDGVLTDGRIIYGADGTEYKCFYAHDGYGITRAIEKGLTIAWISGRKSKVVAMRARELGITSLHQDVDDKVSVYEALKVKHKLHSKEVCFIGDDEFDLPLLKKVSISAAPSDAVEAVRAEVDFVTTAPGGRGAVRELLDMILSARKLHRVW